MPPRDLRSLKRDICARVRDFELVALLDLLATMGYRPGEVWFRGHVTEMPQPTLVHHIEFAEADGTIAGPDPGSGSSRNLGSITELAQESLCAGATTTETAAATAAPSSGLPSQVTVTVNLGLLSCRSPLPSYFQQLMRDPALQEPLVELLQTIDRSLLHARLTCDRPEYMVDRWEEITSDLLRIHGLDSLVGLSWLFRHVFPELVVTVERTLEQLRVPYLSARLGSSHLGSACFGAVTRIDVHDFQVTLRSEESLLRPGAPWLREVELRLHTIVFPALDTVCMNLTIVLELDDDHAVAVLRDDRGLQRDSYLGVDVMGLPDVPRAPQRMRDARRAMPRPALPPRRVVLYHGLLPRDQPDTDELESALAAQDAKVTAPTHASRVPTAPGDDDDPDDIRSYGDVDRTCDLELTIELGGHEHRYQATVRWGVRAWFRDEPYAIELRYDHLAQPAPTSRRHPHLWSLLRDRARRTLIDELATTSDP